MQDNPHGSECPVPDAPGADAPAGVEPDRERSAEVGGRAGRERQRDETQTARLLLFPEVARLAESPLLRGCGEFIIAAPTDPMGYVIDQLRRTPDSQAVLVLPSSSDTYLAHLRAITPRQPPEDAG